LAAQSTVLVCGLLIMGMLARKLGPAGYGQYAVVITVLSWVESSLSSFFSRAVIKSIAESDDWEPVARTALRSALVLGTGLAILLAALAWPLAAILGMKDLAWLLALIAIDIPIFLRSQIYLQIFAGLHSFRGRAIVTATRSIARLVLVLLVIVMGGGVTAATLTWLGASLAELFIARTLSTLRLDGARASTRALFVSSIPLFVAALCMRFTDGMDLFIVKMLTDEQTAGWYAGAVNLALVPAFLGMALMPVILSGVAEQRKRLGMAAAGVAGAAWLRLGLMLLPFAAIGIVLSSELTFMILGPEFARTADFLSLLLMASAGRVWLTLATAFLAGMDRATVAARISVVYLLLSPIGVAIGFTIAGAPGAAGGYAIMAWVGVLMVIVTLLHTRLVAIPWHSALRAFVVFGTVLAIGMLLPAGEGILHVVLAGALLAVVTLGLFVLLGEKLPGQLIARIVAPQRTIPVEVRE
jgi:O-antigen/teichoic acid export membrane protein